MAYPSVHFPRRLLVTAVATILSPLAHAAEPGPSDATRLSTQVVTASGFEQDVAEAPASISVITREELQQKGVSSIAEALDEIEGVDVEASVGKTGGMNISIRGMPSDYTLILIDGRRQNPAGQVTPNGFGETQTSFFPPVAAIERIEVVRGPMSTLYGSDAMGGVVNIITRKVSKQWNSAVTLEGTVHEDSDFGDSRAASLYTSGPLVQDRLGLQLRGRVFERDASRLKYLDVNGDPVEVDQRGPSPVKGDIYSLGGRLTYTPSDKHDLWLDVEAGRQTYDNREGQLGTLGAGGYAEELRFNRDQVVVGHTSRLAVGMLETSLMSNTTETLGRLIPPGTPNKVAESDRTLETENLVLDTKLVMPVGDSHVATVGGQWWDAEMTDGVAPAKFTQTTWALFGEDEWMLRDDLALTLGARYDKHDAFGGNVSPRAYLVWNASDNWVLKGGVSRGYKAPRLDQLADGIVGFGGQGKVPLFGNPDLEPEKSTSTEIGAIFDNQRGFMAGVTAFYNEFSDKIASGPDLLNCTYAADPNRPGCVNWGDWPLADTFSQSLNIDEAVTYGAEFVTRIALSERWWLTGSYTFTESEQKSGENEGEPLTDTPKHMLNAKLRWQATERLGAWLSAEYFSERYRARERVRGAPSYDDLGDYKAYSLFHLGANYRASDNVSFAATVQNLLDKDFVDYRAYTVGSDIEYGNVYANNEPGRRLWLSTTVEF
ncbi:MAG: TonB-dependent receptor [Gammaproteobacteria bacterium]|nr:TonB-dependent receptor [Gammaproteobacteria bacterium]